MGKKSKKSAAMKPKLVVGTGNFKKKVISDSMGVHPSQIKEAMEMDRKLGFATEYLPDGRIVFDNSAMMRSYCKAHGFVHMGY